LEDNKTKESKYSFEEFDEEILREYDIRGIINQNLSVNTAYSLGLKFGTLIKSQNNINKIVIGYDGRLTSPSLHEALTAGLVQNGLEVIIIGLCPTPMLYFSVYHLNVDAGIMITGSHNPPEYNGFKIVLNKKPFYSSNIQNLKNIVFKDNYTKGLKKNINILDQYTKRLLQDISIEKKLKVAWDAGNGSVGVTINNVIKRLKNTENILINDVVDGTFPNHHPDPTIPKNLKQLRDVVKKNKCDLGLAFDGDGDRLGIIDNKDNIIWADQYMIILAEEIAELYDNPSIIMDVKSSKVFFDEVKKIGCNPIMYKTGHSVIKDKMEELNSPLSGEMSGHIMYKDNFFGYDDAMYVALRLLQIISKKEIPLSEIISKYPKTYSTPETRIKVIESRKFKIVEEIIERLSKENLKVISIDGVRVENNEGWWGIRASNTENALTVRAEALSEESLKKMKKNKESQLKLSNVNFNFAI